MTHLSIFFYIFARVSLPHPKFAILHSKCIRVNCAWLLTGATCGLTLLFWSHSRWCCGYLMLPLSTLYFSCVWTGALLSQPVFWWNFPWRHVENVYSPRIMWSNVGTLHFCWYGHPGVIWAVSSNAISPPSFRMCFLGVCVCVYQCSNETKKSNYTLIWLILGNASALKGAMHI